ncbi:MAG: TonB-dependent receptor [Halieaceae bacterium]|nr:TonB-dependent receptor [Halieaceae bacterium]
MTSKKPAESFGGHIETRLGNYNRRDAKAVLNLPLIDDKLLSKISLASIKRDGYLDNLYNGQETNSEDRLAGALQLTWRATDSLVIDSFVYYGKTREVQQASRCSWMDKGGYEGQDALHHNRMWAGDTAPVWLYEFSGLSAAAASSPSSGFAPINSGNYTEISPTYKSNCDATEALAGRDKVQLSIPRMAYNLDNLMAGITVEWEVSDNLTLKSITGYGDQKLFGFPNNPDNDGTVGRQSQIYRLEPSDRDQISQELQFSGSAFDDRLQFTGGIFGMVEEIKDGAQTNNDDISAFYLPGGMLGGLPFDIMAFATRTGGEIYEMKNTTYAAFFQGSYDLSDNLALTMGVRWTREKREQTLTQTLLDPVAFDGILADVFSGSLFLGSGSLALFRGGAHTPSMDLVSMAQSAFSLDADGLWNYPLTDPVTDDIEESWEEVSPMASISYKFPDQWLDGSLINSAMTYVTYSEGFKSGTFQPNGDVSVNGFLKVEPETVTNYELGFKIDGFDRRVRLNTALFHMVFDQMQLIQVVPDPITGNPNVVLKNADKSFIDGIELELTVLPMPNLAINASISYNKYEFDKFDDLQLSSYHILTQSPPPAVDRSDENFPEVPEKTFSLGVQYSWLGDFGTVVSRLDYHYTGEIYMGLDAGSWGIKDQSTFDSFSLINARVAWLSPDENWEVALWGTNLTDEDYFMGAAAVGDSVGTFPKSDSLPRMYGVELRYNLGSR